MNNPTLIKNMEAAADVAAYRIVKHVSGSGTYTFSASATDAHFGVQGSLSALSGERSDVIVAGIAEVEYGGNVTAGDELTADASGKAVAAAPSAGVNNRVIGVAMVSGVSGDIGSVLIAPGRIQG